MSNSFDKQYDTPCPSAQEYSNVYLRAKLAQFALASGDVEAYEWLHRFIVGYGDIVAPLGRRWLINALGHLSDGLDNAMRGK